MFQLLGRLLAAKGMSGSCPLWIFSIHHRSHESLNCISLDFQALLSFPVVSYLYFEPSFRFFPVLAEHLLLRFLSQPKTGGFPGGSDGKDSACNAGYLGSIPGLGRSPREGSGYPLQYSCLENSMDRGVWQAIVHKIAESDTIE